MEKTAKVRPYWHVDFKWVFGILAFASLWGGLLLNAFSTLTEKPNATAITSSVVSNILTTNGIDTATGIEQLKAQAAQLPDGAVLSVPNLPEIKISKEELLSKSSDEIKALALSQLTGPLYEQGLSKTSETVTQTDAQKQSFTQQAGILGVISKQTHEWLAIASKVALATSIIWFVGLIYFSSGWGRLVSPGVVLLLASPVGAAVGTLLEILSKKNDSLLSFLPQSVMSNLASAINGTYRIALFAGLGLLAIAGVGKITTNILAKNKTVEKKV
jgi:hypothetical protein